MVAACVAGGVGCCDRRRALSGGARSQGDHLCCSWRRGRNAQGASQNLAWFGAGALHVRLSLLWVACLCWRCSQPLLKLWDAAPRPEAKAIFDAVIEGTVGLAQMLTLPLHNGAFSRYGAVMAVTVIVAGYYAWATGTVGAPTRSMQPAGPIEIAGWIMLVAATLAMVFMHRNRLLSLVLIGIVGLMVSVGFVFFSAPDLAMTQVTVEVVTTILLLLALELLAKRDPDRKHGPAPYA